MSRLIATIGVTLACIGRRNEPVVLCRVWLSGLAVAGLILLISRRIKHKVLRGLGSGVSVLLFFEKGNYHDDGVTVVYDRSTGTGFIRGTTF